MHHPTDRIAHTTAFVTPVVEHWLEREIAEWVQPMKDRFNDQSHHERTLLPRSYISLPDYWVSNKWYFVHTAAFLRWVQLYLCPIFYIYEHLDIFRFRKSVHVYASSQWVQLYLCPIFYIYEHLDIFRFRKSVHVCASSQTSVRSWCDGSSDRSFMGWTH